MVIILESGSPGVLSPGRFSPGRLTQFEIQEFYNSSIVLLSEEITQYDIGIVIQLRGSYLNNTSAALVLNVSENYNFSAALELNVVENYNIGAALDLGHGESYEPVVMLKQFDIQTNYSPGAPLMLGKSKSYDGSLVIGFNEKIDINMGVIVKLFDISQNYNASSVIALNDIESIMSIDNALLLPDIITEYDMSQVLSKLASTNAGVGALLRRDGLTAATYSASASFGVENTAGVYMGTAPILLEEAVTYDVATAIKDIMPELFSADIITVLRNNVLYLVGVPLQDTKSADYSIGGIVVLRTPTLYTPGALLRATVPITYNTENLLQLKDGAHQYLPRVLIIDTKLNLYTPSTALQGEQLETYDVGSALELEISTNYSSSIPLQATQEIAYSVNVLTVDGNGELFEARIALLREDIQKSYDGSLAIVITDQEDTYNIGSAIALPAPTDYSPQALLLATIQNQYTNGVALEQEMITTYSSQVLLQLEVQTQYNPQLLLQDTKITDFFGSVAIFNIVEQSNQFGGSVVLTRYGIIYPVDIPIVTRGLLQRLGFRAANAIRQGFRSGGSTREGSKASKAVREGTRGTARKIRKL